MKAKLLGIIVIGVLALSIVATTAGAVAQVINEGSTASADDFGRTLVAGSSNQTHSSEDGAVVGTLRFVCPFH